MSHYKSNVRDLEFNLFEVFNRQDVLGTGIYEDVDVDVGGMTSVPRARSKYHLFTGFSSLLRHVNSCGKSRVMALKRMSATPPAPCFARKTANLSRYGTACCPLATLVVVVVPPEEEEDGRSAVMMAAPS